MQTSRLDNNGVWNNRTVLRPNQISCDDNLPVSIQYTFLGVRFLFSMSRNTFWPFLRRQFRRQELWCSTEWRNIGRRKTSSTAASKWTKNFPDWTIFSKKRDIKSTPRLALVLFKFAKILLAQNFHLLSSAKVYHIFIMQNIPLSYYAKNSAKCDNLLQIFQCISGWNIYLAASISFLVLRQIE